MTRKPATGFFLGFSWPTKRQWQEAPSVSAESSQTLGCGEMMLPALSRCTRMVAPRHGHRRPPIVAFGWKPLGGPVHDVARPTARCGAGHEH